MNLSAMEQKLKQQVQREYSMGYEHVRDVRDTKRDVLDKLLPVYNEWDPIKITLLWKNVQLENSLFLNDEIDVKWVSEDGVLSREVVENLELASKYDNEEMDLYHMRERIVNENAIYGLSATVVEWFDDIEMQPIVDGISPLSIIPDPKCWQDSKMRFIGFERRLSAESVRNNPIYDVSKVTELTTYSQEIDDDERASNRAGKTSTLINNEGMVDIYNHFTIYDGKKWLTTWIDNIGTLIRCVEIEPLTKAERLKPSKVSFPIQLHRRKPKYNCFFGVSIADEVLQYQDNISVLSNLQLIQARQAALGPDKFVDQNLGIDVAKLAEKKPGWRYIPVQTMTGNVWTSIFTEPSVVPSQFPFQIKNELNQFSESTTGANSLAFGQSIGGSQTKAEVQTLQQNTNQILGWIAANYLRGQKDFWKAWYRAYSVYMGANQKKNIALYQDGNMISRTLRKSEFVSEGKMQVYVVSKSQQDAEDQKDFARILSLANLYLPNMKPWYAMNMFLRQLGDKLGVSGFDSYTYIEESIDEITARQNLSLLNKNIEVSEPQPGEDLRTYIAIYQQALDTPAKAKALEAYTLKLLDTREPVWMWTTGQADATSGAMAMNMVSSQQSQQIPSTQSVSL